MDINGELKDPFGKPLIKSRYNYEEHDNNYRYEDNNNDSLDTDKQIKEDKKNKKQSGYQPESMDDNDNAMTGTPTPGFSLVKSFF